VAACGVMRVLFSTTAGTGHFGPLIPFAKACTAAGHTVAVAAPGSFADAVTGAGFRHLAVSEPPAERIAAQRVAEVKAGIHLAGGLAAVADLPAALGSVLDDAAFIEGARAMAAEIAALPDVAECLPLLEQLASEKDVRR
jgi:UDP:flavonoid glycosyltransferase YjiC (YdhE family)